MISQLDKLQDNLLISLTKSLNKYNVTAFNESVFRYFLVNEMLENGSFNNIQSELDRYDIVYQYNGKTCVLELKFYTNPISIYPSGLIKRKGGAGRKNFDNFQVQIEKLREAKELSDHTVIDEKILWLFFQSIDHNGQKTKYNIYYQRDHLKNKIPGISSTRNQKRIKINDCIEFRTLLLKII
ncbi:MAG: hypothetical protein ACOWWR_16185 [Eubacteriales bacterium]